MRLVSNCWNPDHFSDSGIHDRTARILSVQRDDLARPRAHYSNAILSERFDPGIAILPLRLGTRLVR